MIRPAPFLTQCALTAILVCGCKPPADQHAGFSASDSAGVRIAINDTPLERLQPVITAAATPPVSIGVLDGEPAYMFDEIADATRLESGHIVIVDNTQQLRVFDSLGRHTATHGRNGQGPGEFLSVSDIVPQRGDTMLVWDRHAMRFSSFTATRGFLDRQESGRKNLSDLLIKDYYYESFYPVSDGSLIVEVDERLGYEEKESSRPFGVFSRMPGLLIWVNADFSSYRMLGERGRIHQGKFMVAGTPQYFISPSGFFPHQAIGGAPQRVCIDAMAGAQVNCYTADGRTIYLRWYMEPQLLPEGAKAQWIESSAKQAARFRRVTAEQVRAGLASAELPRERASVGGIAIDARGHVWVRSTDLQPDTSGNWRYRVFDPEGELLGVAIVPAGQPLEIGPDYLLILRRSTDGVESVVMHRFVRGLDASPARLSVRTRNGVPP